MCRKPATMSSITTRSAVGLEVSVNWRQESVRMPNSRVPAVLLAILACKLSILGTNHSPHQDLMDVSIV